MKLRDVQVELVLELKRMYPLSEVKHTSYRDWTAVTLCLKSVRKDLLLSQDSTGKTDDFHLMITDHIEEDAEGCNDHKSLPERDCPTLADLLDLFKDGIEVVMKDCLDWEKEDEEIMGEVGMKSVFEKESTKLQNELSGFLWKRGELLSDPF